MPKARVLGATSCTWTEPRAGTERFPDELHTACARARPHDALYAHQADARDAAARGEHVIVTTGTASGKTLAFNLPVLDALAREPKLRALYLYPTKALAQDQARRSDGLALPLACGRRSTTATRRAERRWQIRKWANLILTNPDMLHVGVLPHHDRWGDVLSNLRYVVVDEAHVYRGVFGSHVGNVLRRLRLAARLRSRPAVPARLGDDRQPRRAGALAPRRRRDRRRRRRGSAGRAARSLLEPGSSTRSWAARERARRGARLWPSSSPAACARSASPRAARRPS